MIEFMPTNKEKWIEYAASGGLYLYDNECRGWRATDTHMPMLREHKEDWLIFFDVLRDQPTIYTESIIDSITHRNLRPTKGTYVKKLTAKGWSNTVLNKDYAYVDFWYWRVSCDIWGNDSIFRIPNHPPKHMFDLTDAKKKRYMRQFQLLTVREVEKNPYRFVPEDLETIYALDSLSSAWRLLFQIM